MRVSAQARVRYAGHDYSMPPGTIGQPATLHLYPAHVEIVTTTGTAVRHARTAEATSIRPEHRAALLDAVRGVRGKLYFQRQSLWELGPAAEAWLTELVHRRPTQWRRDVEACFPKTASGATVVKSTVVRIPRSVYRPAPGLDRLRPTQETPVPNLFLAGGYTRQRFYDSMEGAVSSGNRAARALIARFRP